VAGGNFGYPGIEGPGQPEGAAAVVEPVHAFHHLPLPNHHAVIDGGFAGPGNFPLDYVGDYFYGDFNQKKIFRVRLDAENAVHSVKLFATTPAPSASLAFGPDGALYYAAWTWDEIRKIEYIGPPPRHGRAFRDPALDSERRERP
jgi:hypothetical protein